MYELIPVSEHDYYINCPAKIGLVKTSDDTVVLIDSGSDKDAGKKVLRVLESNGWKLTAIFNTHSHADHIGGNRFLQEKTGCKIYARGLEAAFTNHPILEPIGLYGGLPFRDLQHKFLMAQESVCLPLSEEVLPQGMKLLPLPGHCFDMVGFVTPDGNAYIADSVSSPETLEKYGIGYLFDPEATLATLEMLKTLDAKAFIPAHAPVTDSIAELAQINMDAINGVKTRVLMLCREEKTFEEILQGVFDSYHLTMTAQQYVLIGSTLRSYLSSLYTQGVVSFRFDGNRMVWQAK